MASKTLKHLGQTTKNFSNPDINILEAVDNPHPDVNYVTRFTCPEFTSICPVTGQPDFAHFVIDYIAQAKMVESKSLKLYLFSYRNHGAFHEDCTIQIAKDICDVIEPKWFRIAGFWYPRGGIPIDVFYEYGKRPNNLVIPEMGVANYRGRG